MKVCVVGLRGVPNVSGGIETHCENLYGRLAMERPDLSFTVFGRRPYIGRAKYRTSSGVEVFPAFAFRNKYLETVTNTVVSIVLARFKGSADYLHLHAIGPGLFAPMARLLGMPVILTHHGDDFRREKWNRFAKSVLRLGERVGVANAAQVIAVSPTLAERLRQDYPDHAARIHYVPNGADHILGKSLLGDAPAVLHQFGLVPARYVVTVGRLVPEKGFADLIRAHRQSGSELPLVIVGGRSNSEHDRELRDLADDRVIFTGALPQADVAQLLAQAKLFVLPSHHEGLPIAALEAWAMGAPLLLSGIQPNRDLTLPEGHYFPVGDIGALADRLRDTATPIPPVALPPEFKWTSIALQTAEIYDLEHDVAAAQPT